MTHLPSSTIQRRRILALSGGLLLTSLSGCKPSPTHTAIPPNATVLALGDSITHGTGAAKGEDWPSLLADTTGWHLVNAGIPGDTAQHARTRLDALLQAHQPTLVIVELGGNDFLQRRSTKLVKEDLRDIVRRSRTAGAQVVLVAVPEPSLLAAVASRLSDAELYQALADEESILLIQDVIAEILSDKTHRSDAVHPNAQGYRQMAQAMHGRLQSWGFSGR